MRVAGRFSFKNGADVVATRYPKLLGEIEHAIAAVRARKLRTKVSKEKTMRGAVLYSPMALNGAFKSEFSALGWKSVRVQCDYSDEFYVRDGTTRPKARGAFREMDFVKDRLGVEVQFGKYAFMVYNVCAKMTIFHNLGHIDAGVEIVPMKTFAEDMSSGVSYFEQFVWDLQHRGESDIDIPVLVLGIDHE
ncbi:restriction endonuclease [candidate division WOR-3 bacterium]|nr:restriction endonuclease [candidate division WOR-3 bacterium]